jgi:AraC-like DNA-binding protein
MRELGFIIDQVSDVSAKMPNAHEHYEIEFNLIAKGSVEYWMSSGVVRFNTGEVAAFWGAYPHRIVQRSADADFFYLSIPIYVLMGWTLPECFFSPLLAGRPLVQKLERNLELYIQQWSQWKDDFNAVCEDGPARRQVAMLEIHAFIERMALTASAAHISEAHETPQLGMSASVAKLARVIGSRFKEPITVADIAREVGVHPCYAVNAFKKIFGMTINEALNRHRIAYAKERLLSSDITVLEIAGEAGFQSISRFYEWFGRLCHEPPEKYRQRLRQP